MKLTSLMLDLEGGTASLGLFGEPSDAELRPPHVQITVMTSQDGTADEMRHAAIEKALEALDVARSSLKAEL